VHGSGLPVAPVVHPSCVKGEIICEHVKGASYQRPYPVGVLFPHGGGPLFRAVGRYGTVKDALTPQSVALIVKRAARAAGLDSSAYSGHSLRAGFVTQGALNGATEANIMRQTGHESSDTVRGYMRIANVFTDNVSGLLGL